ncbi:fimbrial protein [Klebsiella aerogenes]
MMMRINLKQKAIWFWRTVILLVLLVCGGGVQSVSAVCKLFVYGGGTPSVVSNELMNATISAPADVPVGTILYKGAKQDYQLNIGVMCDHDQREQFYMKHWVDGALGDTGYKAGSGAFSHIPGNGTIYKTNIPGIGIVFDRADDIYPHECGVTIGCFIDGFARPHYFYLVKTGNVTPGILNGSQLPVFHRSLGPKQQMLEIWTRRLSGQVIITAPTCQTPDVRVEMDKWSVSHFTGKGATTAWKDASITMNNCGQFYGYSAGHNHSFSGGISHTGPAVKNTWELNLAPQNGALDAAKGIMAISPDAEASATGIGIQLGFGSTTSAESNLVNFTVNKSESIDTSGVSTIKIPLAARYIQTEDKVTAGRADGKLTFTITYK